MAKKKNEAPIIETKRLVLRQKKYDDFPYMMKMFNDDEVRKFMGGHPPRDERSIKGMIRHRSSRFAAGAAFTGAEEIWFSVINILICSISFFDKRIISPQQLPHRENTPFEV